MHIDNATIIQFIKYTLTGVLATFTHIIIFHFIGLKIFPALQAQDHAVRFFKLSIKSINEATRATNSMISNCLAFLVANLVAYFTNIMWVFEGGKYNFVFEILLFYAVSCTSALLGTVLMGVLVKRFGILTTYAFSANIFSAVMINYGMRKFFIFHG